MDTPTTGSDGHAYLCIWADRRKWIPELEAAMATDAICIIQRCIRGPRRGTEWTIRTL